MRPTQWGQGLERSHAGAWGSLGLKLFLEAPGQTRTGSLTLLADKMVKGLYFRGSIFSFAKWLQGSLPPQATNDIPQICLDAHEPGRQSLWLGALQSFHPGWRSMVLQKQSTPAPPGRKWRLPPGGRWQGSDVIPCSCLEPCVMG